MATPMLAMSSRAAALDAVGAAREVVALAYTLSRGAMLAALESAARRGAHVRVRLEGAPFDDPSGAFALHNRAIVAELRASGADAQLVDSAGVGCALHAKAVLADGRLFFDDRNFARDDVIVSDDDPAAARAVRDVAGDPRSIDAPPSALSKRDAIAREVALLDGARGDVSVETESFGRGPVFDALERLARRGSHVRLLVDAREARSNARERVALHRLEANGIEVRTCRDPDKLAVTNAGVWIGSANATQPFGPPTIDWGDVSSDSLLQAEASRRFDRKWSRARLRVPDC